MQISFKSQHIFNFPQYNFSSAINVSTKNNSENELLTLPNYDQCCRFLSNVKNRFNPEKAQVKKLLKLLNDENGKFSLQKAAKYIKQLTDSQLLLYSPDDIKNVINTVMQINPNISKNEILNTLAQLTSFSNYDSISSIEEYCKKENITQLYKTEKLTINNVLAYLADIKKSIFKLPNSDSNSKTGLFVDRNTIEELKGFKNTKPDDFEQLKSDISQGKIKIILLDGWEAKTLSGYKSFNFIGAWGDLAETVTSVLHEKNDNNCSVFNEDIVKNIENLFGDNVSVDIIKNMPDTVDENTIVKRLNPKTLNEADIASAIKTFSNLLLVPDNLKIVDEDYDTSKFFKFAKTNNNKKISLQQLLSLMVIYTCNTYSPRKIALELKDMHKKLSERCFYYDKPDKNMLFIVPKKEKSYGLINYQYSKVNDIPLENYTYINKDDLTTDENMVRNKILVLFDDFSGSGHSLMWELLPYSRFRYVNKQPVIFAALTYLPKAQKAIENEIDAIQGSRFIKDSFIGGKKLKTLEDLAKVISHRKINLLTRYIDEGYASGGSTIAFPHVIPDNCIDISGLILENLLRNKTANKAKINKQKQALLAFYN